MATGPADIPLGMRRIYRRFARWRGAHPGVRLPIPGRLWASAAEAAREHGVGGNGTGSAVGVRQAEAESGSAVAKVPATRARRVLATGKA
jgi:hypothetical protein